MVYSFSKEEHDVDIHIGYTLERVRQSDSWKETESNFFSNSLEILVLYDPGPPRPQEGRERVLSHFLDSVFFPRKKEDLGQATQSSHKEAICFKSTET